MNLIEALKNVRSKESVNQIVSWVGTDTDHFAQLMTAMFGTDLKVANKAAWIMSNCTELHPTLFVQYIGAALTRLQAPNLTDSLRLQISRALQFVHIPEAWQGIAAQIYFDYLANPEIPVAPRCFGMTILANICRDVPELADELRLVIEEHMPHNSTAYRGRGKEVIKMIQRKR